MIGMALFQGLLDREGRVLDKANRLAKSGFAALEVDAHSRATIAFVKALEILGAQEPRARIEDFQEAYATIGSGLLRVGRIESAQTAATHALTGNGRRPSSPRPPGRHLPRARARVRCARLFRRRIAHRSEGQGPLGTKRGRPCRIGAAAGGDPRVHASREPRSR